MMLGATTDPTALVPGSVAAIDAAVVSWRERADAADDAAAALRRSRAPEDWTGAAAIAYESRVVLVARPWSLLHEALDAAATALGQYGATLQWAQGQAQLAIDTWAKAESAAAAPLLQPVGTSVQEDESGPLRAEAREILAHARSELAAAGDRAAAVIRAATAEPDLRDATWATLGRAVSTPAEALAFTAGLTGAELDAALDARPDVAFFLAQAEPDAVHSWWEGLRPGQQEALVASIPALIGNLGGVAYAARDRANHTVLKDRLEQARATLARAEEPLPWFPPPSEAQTLAQSLRVAEAHAQLQALEAIDAALVPTEGGASRFLVSLTSDAPPLAAVAIGSIDTADNVTYAVPGMGSSAAGMEDWAQSAQNVWTEQSLVDPDREHAVVAWVGYESPPIPLTESENNLAVFGTEHAHAGAENFTAALEGVHATRGDASLNVVAHSYGTTTASIALADSDVRVSSYVSLGSAGLPESVDRASDLNADAVYAGQATDVVPFIDPVPYAEALTPHYGKGDQWAWTGREFGDHPVNPVAPDFGAHVFGTDNPHSGLTPVTDHGTQADGGGYLDLRTESLRNVGLATTGHGDLVSRYVPGNQEVTR